MVSKKYVRQEVTQRFKDVIESIEMPRKQIAEILGLDNSDQLSSLVTGRVKVSKLHAKVLSHEFGVDERYILYGDGERNITFKTKNMTASDNAKIIKSGHSSINVDGNSENISIGISDTIKLTEIERKVILRNREVGNNKMLNLFLKKLDELDEFSNKL